MADAKNRKSAEQMNAERKAKKAGKKKVKKTVTESFSLRSVKDDAKIARQTAVENARAAREYRAAAIAREQAWKDGEALYHAKVAKAQEIVANLTKANRVFNVDLLSYDADLQPVVARLLVAFAKGNGFEWQNLGGERFFFSPVRQAS